jgi:hypothetical protein
MSRIGLVSLLCALGLTLIVGYSKDETSLRKYARETLISGTGFEDLRLRETTLDDFIGNIGKGRMAIVAGDESAFEFSFHDDQIAFQFLIDGACRKEIALSRDMRSAVHDLDEYFERHPGCRDLTLSSISVGQGSRLKGTFYKGVTEKGVALGSSMSTTFDHGQARKAAARLVAGLSPDNPEDVVEYPGILFYYDRGTTGKLEDTVIKRITIFSEPD